ncbi:MULTISPECIES: hypothetical protein [Sinorhizobium]|uniref:Uncharacterized protein n=2 Tax=Sinorhizobium TaxID=28105 RepID=A0A6N7LIT0_SINTE|nr:MULTISPECIES: hypothetical protein [Sinorhizobium]MBB4188953.1 hypothetical protein [Sinorhizobium terangae]MCZ4093359.1 hypothetical protein [Sinorhizobium psoraleae]MQX17783.1 hypothetical protein [Sinorhizobium terangae]
MVEINLPESEISALKAIDERELDRLIDRAIQDEALGDLHRLPLSSCGAYVSNEFRSFGESLKRYRESRSAKKREETRSSAVRAGNKLSFAVMGMKRRMETEKQEGKLFRVDDNVLWPYTFSRKMQVTIGYRWRRTVKDEWQFGSITFEHKVNQRPVYQLAPPKRKPSAAKQARQLQAELASIWEHFMRQALYSVRNFFREGGVGSDIPERFRAIPDAYDEHLNNYSTVFWKNGSGSTS